MFTVSTGTCLFFKKKAGQNFKRKYLDGEVVRCRIKKLKKMANLKKSRDKDLGLGP